ncbi:hypothetical protein [Thalassomonas actiniarum]|uniref:Uncharacterized protein n=1 Tax=Thalassomonas actiniarum TaxID=485447 RepID=A0AAF0C4Z8_9GAMM|nr:hypothetical protein [Thalassomonas actiniarum]WDE00345.1 hypothetical protein SG35_006805 [Thalassomonas actiniarum]
MRALSFKGDNLLSTKSLTLLLLFILGYGAASFQFSRAALETEINNYHKEILIASRLLEEYSNNCATNKQSNFSPYVEHATIKYELLLKKSEKFPYFMSGDFILDHEESAFEFNEKRELTHKAISLCKET